MVIYLFGDYLDEREAKIDVLNRGFLFGDGVFTTFVVEDGSIFFLDEHLKRLHDQAGILGIEAPKIDKEEVKKFVLANNADKGVWKIKMILNSNRGEEASIAPRLGGLIMIIKPVLPLVKGKTKLICFPEPVVEPLAKIKTLSYVNRFWIKEYALEHKADDCLVKDHLDHVLETSFANLFWIHKEFLFYPDTNLSYLAGITLQQIVKCAKKMGLTPKPGKYKEEHLLDSFVYLCSSTTGIVPIHYLGSHAFEIDLKLERKLNECLQECAMKSTFRCT